MKIKYRVSDGVAWTICNNGIELDDFIRELLRLGMNPEDVKLNVLSAEEISI